MNGDGIADPAAPPVKIDATALSTTDFLLYRSSAPVANLGMFGSGVVQTLELAPGTYQLYMGSGLAMRCSPLTVSAGGVWDFPASCDQFITGRGTDTLRITGHALTIDARPLSTPVVFVGWFGLGGGTPFTGPRTVRLVPTTGPMTVQPGSGQVAASRFSLTLDGRIDYPDRLEGCLSGRGTSIVTMNGFPVTVDARQLSTDRFALANAFGQQWQPSETPYSVRLLPLDYPAYRFRAGTDYSPLRWNVDLDGEIDYVATADGWVSGRGTTTLVVRGFPIEIDARGTAPGNFWIPDANGVGPLERATVHALRLPPVEYTYSGDRPVDFHWSIREEDGKIALGADAGSSVSGEGTTRLTVGRTKRAPFTAVSDEPGFALPPILVQHDPAEGTGIDWAATARIPVAELLSDRAKIRDAVVFLQEGIEKMTGRRLEVRNSADLSRGIVFTTLAGATDDIRDDPAVREALAGDDRDRYAAGEAYFIRSERARMLLVANTYDGLLAAAEQLLESVGYEVLGMGPNWIHAPARSRLVFDVETSGRPGYYLRTLTAMAGQSLGIGTILNQRLSDPADENVDRSYRRWRVGSRTAGQSMPLYPGHQLQAYHREVAEEIRRTGDTAGFLAPTYLGPAGDRQRLPEARRGDLWIDSDPGELRAYVFDGVAWQAQNPLHFQVVLDLSAAKVRDIVFRRVVERTETQFAASPDGIAVMAIEREDGGASDEVFAASSENPDWYPEYLRAKGVPFGRPWALHGHFGLDQPQELWDPRSQSDAMYGFAGWLLHEYDAWIDSLPAERRLTATGKSKKTLVRPTFYSYNYHDVPPGFNPDTRVRVMVANYPKHRGLGKWRRIRNQLDAAEALHRLLPEPPADYRITSLASVMDWGITSLPVKADHSPAAIASGLSRYYEVGTRAIMAETDFNFGKQGLGYYLTAKALWHPAMSGAELDAVRDRWLGRAFGSAAPKMKEYYDFMLAPNYPVNSTSSWGRAIDLIEQAYRMLQPAEEWARRRIDDLKQYWYFYFLHHAGEMNPGSAATREFAWKGQMSYMNAMFVLMKNVYRQTDPAEVAGEEIAAGPAHYTPAETAVWWGRVRERWPVQVVHRFEDATLADGTPVSRIDMNALTLVDEFDAATPYGQFFYNSSYQRPAAFTTTATAADQRIGFKLWWRNREGIPGYFPRDVSYGLERWDPGTKKWQVVVGAGEQPSVEIPGCPQYGASAACHLVEVALPAPAVGTYRFRVGPGGLAAFLAPLSFDIAANRSTGRSSHTYFELGEGLTQTPTYFYIPKGTRSLDLDVWDTYGGKKLRLFTGLFTRNPSAASREIDVSEMKTHRIPLEPGEDGTIARLAQNGFAFPYLHSVPRLWAKSPKELTIPRAIAQADGLTPSR